MSKNLKLKKVKKSFVPEPISCFRIPICLWTFYELIYISRISILATLRKYSPLSQCLRNSPTTRIFFGHVAVWTGESSFTNRKPLSRTGSHFQEQEASFTNRKPLSRTGSNIHEQGSHFHEQEASFMNKTWEEQICYFTPQRWTQGASFLYFSRRICCFHLFAAWTFLFVLWTLMTFV